MYTQQQAIEFGKASAMMALDAWGDYGSVQNSIDCHRDNVRDTLNDERSSQWEADAWRAFDAYIAAHSVEDVPAAAEADNKYAEHQAHSAPCTSRFDGFDQGDRYDDVEMADWQDATNDECTMTRTAVAEVIGFMDDRAAYAGLPTYSEMLAAMAALKERPLFLSQINDGSDEGAALARTIKTAAMLAR
jgi:hypothetical protein